MSETQTTVNKETNEMTMARSFDAPRQIVWDACTKPDLISKWWGPKAFTTIVKEMDVREGGVWHYVMLGTGEELKGTQFEGMEAGGKAFYQEIVEPELLVYKDVFVDKEGNQVSGMPEGMVTFKFEELDGKTTLTMITKYESLEDLEKIVEMGAEQGMSESLDRLEELLKVR
jgi:uncharacterized protein YndB with AHSA1/START domain